MSTQPKAMRLTPIAEWLADKLEDPTDTHGYRLVANNAAVELRRLDKVEFEHKLCKLQIEELRRLNADLLEALEEVVRVFESNPPSISDTVWVTGGSPETLYDHCRAAIAKAEGEA